MLESSVKELHWFIQASKSRLKRTMLEFAEQEIVMADGRFQGRKFKAYRQPFAKHWFDAVDSGKFPRYVATGCTQSGKTTIAFIIPILYHLFEIEETIIMGLPDKDMANDKWEINLEPIIQRTKYRELIPIFGEGSRGGTFDLMQFQNGAIMKIMSAGGSDKERAHFQTRVLAATEIDGFDESGNKSEETDKLSQMEARTLSHGAMQRRIYLECTLTTEEGRTYRELVKGTNSRIACPCPYCKKYVTPERKHLIGWKEATNIIDAYNYSYFVCPECGEKITEKQRIRMNQKSKLIHTNDPAKTDTFSMRWNAFNNLFWQAGDIAIEEWKKEHEDVEARKEDFERKLCQYYWAIPYHPPNVDLVNLNWHEINARRGETGRGEVPPWANYLTCGVDLHKRVGYYLVMAHGDKKRTLIIDYGTFDIPSDEIGIDPATYRALKDFADIMSNGYPGPNGKRFGLLQCWIDSGYSESQLAVYRFCLETGQTVYRATKGYGGTKATRYTHPKKINANIVLILNGYHVNYQREYGIFLFEIDTDFWKTKVHDALAIKSDEGSIKLYQSPDRNEHLGISKHFCSSKKTIEFIPGRGEVIKWVTQTATNHWDDCAHMAYAAADFCEYSEGQKEIQSQIINSGMVTMPDGRPFNVLDRNI